MNPIVSLVFAVIAGVVFVVSVTVLVRNYIRHRRAAKRQ